MTVPTDTAFAGFPREGLEFLAGLAEDNSRAYFDAHRDVYEEALLAPAKAFVVALGEELHTRVAPGLRAEPRVNGSILRINRDTRFTNDKRPYKEHLDFWFWEGDGPSRAYPGLFMRLRPAAVGLGAGVHRFQTSALAADRSALGRAAAGGGAVAAGGVPQRRGGRGDGRGARGGGGRGDRGARRRRERPGVEARPAWVRRRPSARRAAAPRRPVRWRRVEAPAGRRRSGVRRLDGR